MTHDYSAYQKKSDSELAELAELAEKQLEAEKELEAAENEVRRAKRALADISEVEIPELMDKIGISDFTTKSGLKIMVKENIRASISKPNRADALAWLRENGYDALIKRKLTVTFGKGEDDEAAATLRALEEQELQVDDDANVHASTLSKFVREKLEAGEEVPMELLGVFRQRVSTIKV